MKKRILALLLVLMVLFTMTPLATVVTAENKIEQNAELLTNGNFEDVKTDGRTLNYWRPWLTEADYTEYTVVTDDVYEGDYAIRMAFDESKLPGTGTKRNCIYCLEKGTIVAGETYTFTAYAKACEALGSLSIEIKFGSHGEETISYNNNSSEYVTGQYIKLEKTFTAPEVTDFTIYIRVYGGEFILDAFSIKGPKYIVEEEPSGEEIIPQDTTPPEGTQMQVQGEIIPNTSFETTNNLGSLQNWSNLDNDNDYGQYTFTEDAEDGIKAIKMAFDSSKGKLRNTIYQRIDIPLITGEQYKFTALIKALTSEGAAMFQIEQGSFLETVSYSNMQENYERGEYVKLEHAFTAPEGITSFNLFIRITSGEFLFDRVSLTGPLTMKTVESIPDNSYISGGKNLIIDSGFEYKIYKRYGKGGWGSSDRFVSDFGHNSTNSLRISSTTEMERPYTAQRTTVYAGATYQISMWVCMERPSDTQASANAGSFGINIEQYTHAADGSETNIGSQAAMFCRGTDAKWKQFTYLYTPKETTDEMMLMLRLYGRGTVWIDDVEIKIVSGTPWAISVETDEIFYYTDREEPCVATASVNVDAHPELVGEDITFTLLLDGVIKNTSTVKCTSHQNKYNSSFSVNLLAEKQTEYIMRVQIGEYTEETKLYKYDRPLYIDKDGVYRGKNGMVFRPYYAYNMIERHYNPAQSGGFNLTFLGMPDKTGDALVEHMISELDKLQEAGYMAIITTYGLSQELGVNVPGGHPSRREKTATVAAGIKDHPAVFAYINMDEPLTQPYELRDDLRETYIAIRNNDPYHPVITTEQGSYKESAKYVDIFGIDPYVGKSDPLYVGDKVLEAMGAVNGKKPVYVVLQAFKWGRDSANFNYFPTEDEIKNMIYQSLMAGASGIGFYKYLMAKDNLDLDETDIWPQISHFGKNEWARAHTAFVKGDYLDFSTKRETNYWMDSFVKENNELIMYVANRTNQVQQITIPLTSTDKTMSIGAYTVESNSNTQASNSGNGTITINLPANSAEVYTITPENSSDLPDVELPEEEGPISRGDFASMLIKTLGIADGNPSENFADVDESKDYAPQIAAGKALGILVADENGLYKPGDSQTIDDALLLCLRGLIYKKVPNVSAQSIAAFTEDELLGVSYAPVLAAAILENRQAAEDEGTTSTNLTYYEANMLLEKVKALMVDTDTDFANLSGKGARYASKLLKGTVSYTNNVWVGTDGTMTIVHNIGETPYTFTKNIGSETVSIATNTAEITITGDVLSANVAPNKFFIISDAASVRRGFRLENIIYPYPVEGSEALMESAVFLGTYRVLETVKELLGIFTNGDIMPQTAEHFKFFKWDSNLAPKSDVILEITMLRGIEDSNDNFIRNVGTGLVKK